MTLMTLGSIPVRVRKVPKVYGIGRVCGLLGCETRLSQYNKGDPKGTDYCWRHSPFGHARVRGKSPAEMMSKKSNVVNHCKSCSHQDGLSTKILVNGVVHVRGRNGGANCEE